MTHKYDHKLTVSTEEGKILFLLEMYEQISIGYWENVGGNAYQDWMLNAEDIDVNPINPGTNFFPKRTYGFGSKVLYEVIGDRIKFWLNLYGIAPEAMMSFVNADESWPVESLKEWNYMVEKALAGDNYYEWRLLKHTKYGINRKVVEEASTNPKYNDKMVMTVLRRLSKDCKLRRSE